MKRETTPILDYTSQRPRLTRVAWQSVVAAVGIVFIPPFMCIRGHLDVTALVATVPTVSLAWWGFARRSSLTGRILACGVVALASVGFAKNLLDIAWFGHNPLFR